VSLSSNHRARTIAARERAKQRIKALEERARKGASMTGKQVDGRRRRLEAEAGVKRTV